jgi:predicted Zn-dependent peptidase
MISEEIEEVGGGLNAATGRESTSYWCKVPSTHTAMAFDVMADMLRGSVLSEMEMTKERKVIFEEIRSVQDIPEELVHDLTDELVWGDDPLGREIAGSEATVGSISREAMLDFWTRNYGPERLVVAAGGDVDHGDIVRLTEKAFGDLERREDRADQYTPVTVAQDAPRVRVVNRPTEQAHLCLSLPAVSYRDERRYAQSTIDSILSSGMSSRLFQEIREKRGLVYSVFGYFRSYEDVGQGVVYAGCDLDRVHEATEAILGELRKLRDVRVSDEEIIRNRELRKGRLLMGLEDSRSVASWVGAQEATFGEIKTPEEVMEEIDAVSAEDVQALAHELFRDDRLNLVVIGPYDDPAPFEQSLTFDAATQK